MTANPRQSFRLKLCVGIFAVASIVFAIIFLISMYFSAKTLSNSTANLVFTRLSYASTALDDRLKSTELSASNFMSVFESPLVDKSADNIRESCKYFLKANPDLHGIAMACEPGVISGLNGRFSPYIVRTEDGFYDKNLAELYDYLHSDWYNVPMKTGKPGWIPPFEDTDGDVVISYTVPIKDKNGKNVGAIAFGMSLGTLTDSLERLAPTKNSYLGVISKDGTFIMHPDKDSLLKAKLPESIKSEVLNKNISMTTYGRGKDLHHIYNFLDYQMGWNIMADIPRSEIASTIYEMKRQLIFIMLLGLLFLIGVSYFVVTKMTRPLENFAEAARKISHGQFDINLPAIKDHNELYDLRQALASMEVSLKDYVVKLEDTSKKKARIENQLEIARAIQMNMVPKIFPPYPDRKDIDIFASLIPAQEVGGDLYDFVLIGDTLTFCIGDVSGKGVPASLFMAITRALFRNLATAGMKPARIARHLNNAIADSNTQGMFVTMLIGSCDLKTGDFTFCNCGHNAPLTNGIIRNHGTMQVEVAGEARYVSGMPVNIPIGAFSGFDYKEVEMRIDPGIVMLLYTDGITEAESPEKELFGDDRLLEVAKRIPAGSSSDYIINETVKAVVDFRKEAQQSDDITMLCIRYNGPQEA